MSLGVDLTFLSMVCLVSGLSVSGRSARASTLTATDIITLNFANYGYYVERNSGGWCNVQLLQIREDDEGQKSPLLRGSGLSLSGPPVVGQVWPYAHFPSCHAWACCSGRQGSRRPSRDVFTVPLHYPNSTPLSKIASNQWGFQFPASIDISPSDSNFT